MSKTPEKILEKIRHLLSLAEDGKNDEESQTALLMAQKLMVKYKISQDQVSKEHPEEIQLKSLSVYKRLYWWEKTLAGIIADNFRCMLYVQSNKLPHQSSIQRKIVFMGYPEDIELAYEIYHLAAEAIRYYAKIYLTDPKRQQENIPEKDRRKAYYLGFLDGLAEKFKQQQADLQAENERYALVIQTPQAVKEKFNREVKGSLAFNQPVYAETSQSYRTGYRQGRRVELNQNKGRLEDGSSK